MMRSGEVAASLMWSGTAFAAKRQGLPLAWSWRDAIADFGAWGILKGAPHPKAARAFINYYMANPENHVGFAREMGYTTPNVGGQAMLSAEDALKALGARYVLINRDEVLIEAPETAIQDAAVVIQRAMLNPSSLAVPLQVQVGVGTSWLDAKLATTLARRQ